MGICVVKDVPEELKSLIFPCFERTEKTFGNRLFWKKGDLLLMSFTKIVSGSDIDCCKVISAQAVLEEDIWNMEYEKGKFPTAGISMGQL